MATKKVTKSKTAKPAVKKSKKATAIAEVKAFKHKRVLIEPVGTESLPEMVKVVSGPNWVSELIGKRYVNVNFAIAQIEVLDTEKNIAKGAKAVTKELVEAGVTPIDAADIDTDEK